MTSTPPTEPSEPTGPTAPPGAPAPTAAAGAEPVPVYDRAERGRWSTGRVVGLAIATLVVGAIGGWLVGHAGASSSGPSTLAEAMQQARAGDLPTGDMAGGFRFGAGGPNGNGNGNGNANGQGGPAQNGGRVGGPAGAGVFGTIKAIDGDTITITTPPGDVRVETTGSTTVQRTVSGTVTDLSAGDAVRVESADQSSGGSGTVTAKSIQEVPEGAGAFAGRPPQGDRSAARGGS
jgi:hypothetical protein